MKSNTLQSLKALDTKNIWKKTFYSCIASLIAGLFTLFKILFLSYYSQLLFGIFNITFPIWLLFLIFSFSNVLNYNSEQELLCRYNYCLNKNNIEDLFGKFVCRNLRLFMLITIMIACCFYLIFFPISHDNIDVQLLINNALKTLGE